MAEQWDMLTSLQEGIPASHSVLPGSDEARQMTAISGRNLLGLYKKLGPVGLLAKMLLATSAWASTVCFLTWKDAATPMKRLLFRLVPLVPPIDDTESGLLATPTTKGNQLAPSMMKHSGCRRLLATIGANEYKGAGKNRFLGSSEYRGAKMVESLRTSSKDGIYIHPEFAELVMGYPMGWTELEDLETR